MQCTEKELAKEVALEVQVWKKMLSSVTFALSATTPSDRSTSLRN